LQAQDKEGKTGKITGAVYDKSAIAKITIGNKELIFEETQLLTINEHFTAPLSMAVHHITFAVEDVLGNRTTGVVEMPFLRKPAKIPAITIRGLRDGQDMFLDTLTVEGTVWSKEGFKDLMVNRQSLLPLEEGPAGVSFSKLIRENKSIPLTFSKTIELEEGKNTITTALVKITGAGTEKTITITRRIPKVKQIASRMTLAIFPFKEIKIIEEGLSNYVYTFLTKAFEDQKRFHVVSRTELNKTIKEHKLTRETVFDQETAKRLSHLLASDTFSNISKV